MKLADQLGVGLGHRRVDGRWAINGSHGRRSQKPTPLLSILSDGCGTYDLVLNTEERRVDCANCGATDLGKVAR